MDYQEQEQFKIFTGFVAFLIAVFCFLVWKGSKMGRRWIGIEQMDYIEDITKGYLHYMVEISSSSKYSSPPYNSTKVGI